MALIYFYDTTELDKQQLSEGLKDTDHRCEFVHEKISEDNLNSETEVISVFVSSTVTRAMLEKLPNLRVIACRSTGFNNIDLEACAEREITVLNVPSYGESTVAEYAFTLASALLRKLPQVLAAENTQFDQEKLLGSDLHEKTLGVIGTGKIGQHSIRIGNGYGMHVIASDPFQNDSLQKSLGFTYKSLNDVLAESDVITIHAPYVPATHHLINNEALALMKPTAILVNTARGEVVDTSALVEALQNHKIAGVALDVLEGEALLNHHEEAALLRSENIEPDLMRHSVEISLLKKMPNVIISPHNAFNTIEAVARINKTTTDNIINFWYNDTPNAVKPPEKTIGKLLIIRHAESEWNATGQWSGTRNIHLSEKGFKESGKLGQALKKLSIHVDTAFCSEQIRTRETLEGVLDGSQQFDVEVTRASALNERDYGNYTGKNKWDMKEEIGEDAWNAVRRGWDVPVPNGETLKHVYERVTPYYIETILPLLRAGKNVLLVAHGNSIRALMKYIESIPDESIGDLEMMFGEILIYDTDSEGRMTSKSSMRINSPPPHA